MQSLGNMYYYDCTVRIFHNKELTRESKFLLLNTTTNETFHYWVDYYYQHRSLLHMQRTGAVPLSGVSECGLPRELWEVIVQLVDDPSLHCLALVSVFMHKQCFGNAVVWRRKCAAVYTGTATVKPGLLSWKQYYYAGTLNIYVRQCSNYDGNIID